MKFQLRGYIHMLFRRGKKHIETTQDQSKSEGITTSQASIWYKRVGYGSAVALTFLFVPLVAQGLPGLTSDDEPEQPAASEANGGHVDSATTPDASQHGETSVDVSQQASGQGQSSNSSSVDVNVNGQSIPVPQNGSVKKKITNSNGNATVDVSIENHQSGSSVNTHSSTSVDINSNSWSYGNDDANVGGGDRYSNHR